MRKEKINKKRLKLTAFLIYILVILLPLSAVATYTWFSLSKTPKASDLSLYVNSDIGLSISWDYTDDRSWTNHLDFADKKLGETELKPVTWVDEESGFYAASYGIDGRISGINQKLDDERNTNGNRSDSYYVKATYYMKSTDKAAIKLSPAVESVNGISGSGTYLIGAPVWNPDTISHDNAGFGAEYASRIGFRISSIGSSGEETGDPVFYIYEPNCDMHIGGSSGYRNTRSIKGKESLVSSNRLIRQSVSAWKESTPVVNDTVLYELGDFMDDTSLFNIEPEYIVKIDMYIWLEGQDTDCTNQIGKAAKLFANIQFSADMGSQTGFEEL